MDSDKDGNPRFCTVSGEDFGDMHTYRFYLLKNK